MKRTIFIQKVDGYLNGKKNCDVTVDLEWEDGNFSATADLWNHIHSDILTGGQCFDDLLKDYPELGENETFAEAYDLWSKYHLNDMRAGTPEQQAAIKEWKAQGHKYSYDDACDYLKEIGLYEVPISTIDVKANPYLADKDPNSTYKYGHGWLKEEVPEEDVPRIESLVKTGVKYKEPDKEKEPRDDQDLEMDM